MCGRFADDAKTDDVIQEYVADGGKPEDWWKSWAGAYSIAPTQDAPIVRDRGEGRILELVRWLGTPTAIQDNDPNAVNELNVGMLPDQQFLDSQIQEIKKGGTVANAVAYELDDETTPVKLVASNDFGMTEIGSATFTLQ